jgi:hypothetical protein
MCTSNDPFDSRIMTAEDLAENWHAALCANLTCWLRATDSALNSAKQ